MDDGAIRETITQACEVTYTHSKVFRGGGEFAVVMLRLEPTDDWSDIQFVDGVEAGSIPSHMIGGAEEGVRLAAKSGVLEGHLVVGVKVTLINGKYHDMDSNPRTFRTAAEQAFKEGLWKAGPRIVRS